MGHARTVTVDNAPSREATPDVRHDVVHSASTILMLVAALRSRDHDPGLRATIDGIAYCARRITEMMNDVDDRSSPQPIDLATLAAEAGSRAGVLFSGTLTVQVEPAVVRAHELDISRLLTNLIQNACRAAGRDGIVQLTVANEDAWSVIRIGDSGTGFIETPTSGGIGLALVAAIAVRLEGHLTLGRSPLGGALVAVHLPRFEGNDHRSELADTSEERVS